mgnify:CR=1 FL=1
MSQVNNNVGRYQYIVFIVWLIFVVIAAKYFLYDSLSLFDPENRLNGDSAGIVNKIKSDLVLENKLSKKTIIHFTSQDCACAVYSEDHKKATNQYSIENGFEIRNIELSDKQRQIIPSTPAVLVLDEYGELIYLGPYAKGLECSAGSSIVDIVLKNYVKGFNANLIMNNAKGCYCNL